MSHSHRHINLRSQPQRLPNTQPPPPPPPDHRRSIAEKSEQSRSMTRRHNSRRHQPQPQPQQLPGSPSGCRYYARLALDCLPAMASWDGCMVLLHLLDVACTTQLVHSFYQRSEWCFLACILLMLSVSCYILSHTSPDQQDRWGRIEWRAVLLYPLWPEVAMAAARYKMRQSALISPATLLRRLFTPHRLSITLYAKTRHEQHLQKMQMAHSGMRQWATYTAIPLSILNVVYCCSHADTITQLHVSALTVSITFICCSMPEITSLCHLHTPTLLVLYMFVSLDIVHVYITALLTVAALTSSSFSWWYPSRVMLLSLPVLIALYGCLYIALSYSQAPTFRFNFALLSGSDNELPLPVLLKGSWFVHNLFELPFHCIGRGELVYERVYGYIKSGRDHDEQEVRRWWNKDSEGATHAFEDQYLPPCPPPYSSEAERCAVVQRVVAAHYPSSQSFLSASLDPTSLFYPHWLPLLRASAHEVWRRLQYDNIRHSGTRSLLSDDKMSVFVSILVMMYAITLWCTFVLPAAVAVERAVVSTQQDGLQRLVGFLCAAYAVLMVLIACLLPSVWQFYRVIKPLHLLLRRLSHQQQCEVLVSLSHSVHSTLIRRHFVTLLVDDGMLRDVAGIVADYCGGSSAVILSAEKSKKRRGSKGVKKQ